jgi:hypothetical protein
MTGLRVLIIVIPAILAGVAGWQINGWRLQSQIDGMVARHTENLAKANAQALAKYTEMERKKQEALDEASKLIKRNADAARSVGLERDRLRQQLATANSRMSTASCPTVVDYSATLSFVLGECAAEVDGLAKTADGHAVDVRTLINAWPR